MTLFTLNNSAGYFVGGKLNILKHRCFSKVTLLCMTDQCLVLFGWIDFLVFVLVLVMLGADSWSALDLPATLYLSIFTESREPAIP